MTMGPEHSLQESAYVFVRRCLPDAYVVCIDNGYATTKFIRIKRKQRGILSGQPDMRILAGGISVDIELKNPNGKGVVSNHQLSRRREIEANGGRWFCCRSLEEIEAALRSVPGLDVRASAAAVVERREAKAARPTKAKRASKPMAERPTRAAVRVGNQFSLAMLGKRT